jgi:hypothetical protein
MKGLRNFLLLLLIVGVINVVLPLYGAGVVHYVDSASTDGGDGTTTALTGANRAFATIAGVNAHTFAADDTCSFKCGETWNGTLAPGQNGTSSHPITFNSYSTGAKPIIENSVHVTSWIGPVSGVYHASYANAVDESFEDYIAIDKATSTACADGNWFWAAGTVYYKPTTGVASDHVFGLESSGQWPYACAEISYRSYLTFDGLSFKNAFVGINGVDDSVKNNNIIIQNCDFIYLNSAIYFLAGANGACDSMQVKTNYFYRNQNALRGYTTAGGTQSHTNWTVSGNEMSQIGTYNGTVAWPGGGDCEALGFQNLQNSTITLNYVHDGLCYGALLYASAAGVVSGNTITRNRFYNIGAGEALRFTGDGAYAINNNTFAYNILWNCGKTYADDRCYPIYLENGSAASVTNLIANNVVYGGYRSVRFCQTNGGVTSFYTIENNIFAGATDTNLYLYQWSTLADCVIDYNCYNATTYYRDDAGEHDQAWVIANTAFSDHDMVADPLFTSTTVPTFTTGLTSLVRSAGVDVSLTTDYLGNAVPSRVGKAPDMGAYESEPAVSVYFVDNLVTDTHVASATADFTAYNPITFATTGGNASVYKTVADINACTFAAGDTILFRQGQTWREQLTMPSSGSAGLPITFGEYGTGALPIITGADLVGTWTAYSAVDTATINANKDDVHRGYGLTDSYYLSLVIPGGDWPTTSGFVFHGVDVAKSTTITAAKITFTSYGNYSTTTCNWIMNAEAADTTSAFVDETEFLARRANLTTAHAHWANVPAWTIGTTYDTPDISNVIQEVVNRTGWVSGNNITIFFQDDGGTTDSDRRCKSRGGGSTADLAVLSVSTANAVIWQAALTTEPQIVMFDGVRGTKKASIAACTSPRDWFWAANVLYTYSLTDPDATYVAPGIEAPIRDYCLHSTDKDYITYDHLTTRLAAKNNINTDNVRQTGIVVSNCTSEYATLYGIEYEWGAYTSSVSDCIIRYNGEWGLHINCDVMLAGGTCYVGRNTVYSNCWNTADIESAGIHIHGPSAGTTTVEYNTVYNNGDLVTGVTRQGKGIWLSGVSNTAVVRYNHVYNNHMFGIGLDGPASANVQIYYNIVTGHIFSDTSCFREGIALAYTASACTIYNNISYGNIVGIALEGDTGHTQGKCMVNNLVKNNIVLGSISHALYATDGGENDGTYGSGNVYLNNCLGPAGTNFIEWGYEVHKSTYAAWETAYGGTTSSVQVDPLFVITGTDFRLLLNSPCRGKGVNVSLTLDYAGNTVPAWTGKSPDIGAYEMRPTGVIWGPRPIIH